VLADGHWGRALREYMRDYNHWATIGVLNELLPHPDNRVTLADETDPYGQPVARMDYTLSDNDKANMAWSTNVITEILQAGGAQDVLTIQRFAHLIGGARMGSSPSDSVVDANQRSWAVPNLFVSDGSVCPTQGSANPALTVMALASRLAERMASGAAMDDDPAARAGRRSVTTARRGAVVVPQYAMFAVSQTEASRRW
jgi:choline dehydrogenase-like flavoprotein